MYSNSCCIKSVLQKIIFFPSCNSDNLLINGLIWLSSKVAVEVNFLSEMMMETLVVNPSCFLAF